MCCSNRTWCWIDARCRRHRDQQEPEGGEAELVSVAPRLGTEWQTEVNVKGSRRHFGRKTLEGGIYGYD